MEEKSKSKEICIGERIREIFDKSNMNIARFAELLHCDRANVYNIFRRKKIDISLLLEISKILNHNFVEEICAKQKAIKNICSSKISLIFEINSIDAKTLKRLLKMIKQLEIRAISLKKNNLQS